jgi:hypothetical protein
MSYGAIYVDEDILSSIVVANELTFVFWILLELLCCESTFSGLYLSDISVIVSESIGFFFPSSYSSSSSSAA